VFIRVHLWFLIFLFFGSFSLQAQSGFFTVHSIKLLEKPGTDGGVWSRTPAEPKAKFETCLLVTVRTREEIRPERVFAKVHFFDEKNVRVFTHHEPSFGAKSWIDRVQWPVIIKQEAKLYFEVPQALRGKKWKCVAVFGDQQEAHAMVYPSHESMFNLDYPEKRIVAGARRGDASARKIAVDPLVEHVVKTSIESVPQVTLFLRMPKGVSDSSEVKGVLAICVLTSYLEDVRRKLQKEEMDGDYQGLLGFANKHKLAVLVWASRRIWDANQSYDELDSAKAKKINAELNAVANAWSQGVDELVKKYGIPRDGYLLWGNCGSAQWAHRIALRKPEHFLAAYIHMPSSFDKPVPAASKIWWCLTTGENYGGYGPSTRWFAEATKNGYPLIYRPVPGLRHDPTTYINSELTLGFFEFALEQRDNPNRAEFFTKPKYYADYVNQVVFPAAEADKIPAAFRVALPTKKFADLWKNVKIMKQ